MRNRNLAKRTALLAMGLSLVVAPVAGTIGTAYALPSGESDTYSRFIEKHAAMFGKNYPVTIDGKTYHLNAIPQAFEGKDATHFTKYPMFAVGDKTDKSAPAIENDEGGLQTNNALTKSQYDSHNMRGSGPESFSYDDTKVDFTQLRYLLHKYANNFDTDKETTGALAYLVRMNANYSGKNGSTAGDVAEWRKKLDYEVAKHHPAVRTKAKALTKEAKEKAHKVKYDVVAKLAENKKAVKDFGVVDEYGDFLGGLTGKVKLDKSIDLNGISNDMFYFRTENIPTSFAVTEEDLKKINPEALPKKAELTFTAPSTTYFLLKNMKSGLGEDEYSRAIGLTDDTKEIIRKTINLTVEDSDENTTDDENSGDDDLQPAPTPVNPGNTEGGNTGDNGTNADDSPVVGDNGVKLTLFSDSKDKTNVFKTGEKVKLAGSLLKVPADTDIIVSHDVCKMKTNKEGKTVCGIHKASTSYSAEHLKKNLPLKWDREVTLEKEGLYSHHVVVKKASGEVLFESRPGQKGSTFTIVKKADENADGKESSDENKTTADKLKEAKDKLKDLKNGALADGGKAANASGKLAKTGAETSIIAVLASGLLAAGGALTMFARKRRMQD